MVKIYNFDNNQFRLGKASDSMEELERLCNAKASEIAETMTNGDEVSIGDGKMTYKLDFSLSTL